MKIQLVSISGYHIAEVGANPIGQKLKYRPSPLPNVVVPPGLRIRKEPISLDEIQAASIAYRIAIGPHAGRKALTLYSVPPLKEEPSIPLLARMYGFSLHAGTVCEAHQRSKLERLCR